MKKIILWLEINLENIKGGFKLLIPISIIFLIINIPYKLRDQLLTKLDSETIGIVDSINQIKGIKETQTGGKIFTKIFEVKYHFILEETIFNNDDKILTESVTLKERIKIRNLIKGDSITIKFSSTDPNKSMIKLKEK